VTISGWLILPEFERLPSTMKSSGQGRGGSVEDWDGQRDTFAVRESSGAKPVAKNGEVMRYVVLWLFGVPFSVIVCLWALGIC
jgi:hypothetical protein